jgi:hypothetical protein
VIKRVDETVQEYFALRLKSETWGLKPWALGALDWFFGLFLRSEPKERRMRARLQVNLYDLILTLLLSGVCGAVWAQPDLKVIKLRTEKVALLDCENDPKKREFERAKFQGPWAVHESKPGLLAVTLEGTRCWVKAYAVETNKPVDVRAECGAVVAEKQPRSAATRGIGEGCEK